MEYRIAIIQFEPQLGNPTENIARLERLFEKVDQVALVVLPELSNAGYHFADRSEAFQYAEVIDGKGVFQEFLVKTAARRNIHIVSGINERDGNELFNTAILVGPGGMLGKYRKMHLFMNEKDIFQPGDSDLKVYDLGGFRIGMMICFDYLFPEPWRLLAEKGADLVCHPSNLLTENPRKCAPGLALMNRIYIATANRIGQERGLQFNGCSFFTSPEGVIGPMAAPDKEEVLYLPLDVARSANKMVTPRNHVFNDRRPDKYTG